jgi:23S rRNA (adenine2030-N6)-methyltransferase
LLSYRHGFHAGGWADVHKHVVLTGLIRRLREKPAPYTVVDAFAGDGLYALSSPESQKTGEHREGIVRLHGADDAPEMVASYLGLVRGINGTGPLALYPGSPAIARELLRPDDRLILNELHPTAYDRLARWAGGERRIAVHKRDAVEFLGAMVTPKLRRGLVLIDPAYEVKAEYEQMAELLPRLVRAWPNGIFALWYPQLVEGRERGMVAALGEALGDSNLLITEIARGDRVPRGMQGAGMMIVNPPWQFQDELSTATDWLTAQLRPAGIVSSRISPHAARRESARSD